MRTKVSIELTGIAPAVKEASATILSRLTDLEVECVPQYLPERFVIDISSLMGIGDTIRVHDIPKAEGLEILNDPEEIIVIAVAPRGEEIVAEAASEDTGPEVIGGGSKKEADSE
jgi:hypothetical protein